MAEDEFTFETIHQVLLKEKKYKRLGKLDQRFWENSQKLLDDYKQRYQNELAQQPDSLITAEHASNIRRLLQQINHIRRLRERKILFLALEMIDDDSMEIRNLLKPEERLMEELTAMLRTSREENRFESETQVLRNLAAAELPTRMEPVPPAEEPPVEDSFTKQPEPEVVVAEPEPEIVEEPEVPEEDGDELEYVKVRIKKGEGTNNFLAHDNRNYVLRKEDILYLPKINAEVLVQRDFADFV